MNRQNPGPHGLSVLAGKTVKACEINIIHDVLVTVPGRERKWGSACVRMCICGCTHARVEGGGGILGRMTRESLPGKEVVVSRPRERRGRLCWHTRKNICRGRSSRRRDRRLDLHADPGPWRLFTRFPILETCPPPACCPGLKLPKDAGWRLNPGGPSP